MNYSTIQWAGEQLYQYENDYLFDSSKIEKAFSIEATSYKSGIAETLK